MDAYDLYDLCVTEPDRLVRFLLAAHGGSPRRLREDFAGTAALARHWVRSIHDGVAVAVDLDEKPLLRASRRDPVVGFVGDVMRCTLKADVVTATNFSIGYLHTRAQLVAYLRHVRSVLPRGGIFVADLYGGAHAMQSGVHEQTIRPPSGDTIEYTFEQRAANPVTGRVVNALHFAVTSKGSRRRRLYRDAFVYDWRLWGLPELVDATIDAGFAQCDVHDRVGAAVDGKGRLRLKTHLETGELMDEDWVVYVVARK